MQNWNVQQLRFSAFTPIASPELLSNIWPIVSAEPAESEETRPREGFRRLIAPGEDSVLELVFQPGRIDFVKTASLGGDIQPNIHFGEADSQLNAFSERVRQIIDVLASSTTLHRIALGIVLVRPVDDRNAGYKELENILSIKLDPNRSRDFMFQINYPETFSHDETAQIELNRLVKWATMRARRVMFQFVNPVADGAPVSQRPTQLVAEECYVRCEIDNSSSAENLNALSLTSWQQIFSRLIELAYISARGA